MSKTYDFLVTIETVVEGQDLKTLLMATQENLSRVVITKGTGMAKVTGVKPWSIAAQAILGMSEEAVKLRIKKRAGVLRG